MKYGSLFCYEYGINKKFCCSKKKNTKNKIKEINKENKDENLSITGIGQKYIENDEVEEQQQNVKNLRRHYHVSCQSIYFKLKIKK